MVDENTTNEVIVYTSNTKLCPFCTDAKNLLSRYNIPYKERFVSDYTSEWDVIHSKYGVKTIPQIFFGSEHIGGFTSIKKLADDGLLMSRLRECGITVHTD